MLKLILCVVVAMVSMSVGQNVDPKNNLAVLLTNTPTEAVKSMISLLITANLNADMNQALEGIRQQPDDVLKDALRYYLSTLPVDVLQKVYETVAQKIQSSSSSTPQFRSVSNSKLVKKSSAKARDTCRVSTTLVVGPLRQCCCGEYKAGSYSYLRTWWDNMYIYKCPDGQEYENGKRDGTRGIYPDGDRSTWGSYCCCRSGACLSPHALITMADGSTKPVSNIQKGELVLGGDGKPRKVLLVDIAPSEGRRLYGFDTKDGNGKVSVPFVSEDHFLANGEENTNTPFLAVDVEKALKFEPTYRNLVSRLEGNRNTSLRLFDAKTNTFYSQEVNFIHEETIADSNAPLYNLLLEDGHTYIANGVVVSDMFPNLADYPYNTKLVHWMLRENSQIVESFFSKHHAHKYHLRPLVHQITQLIHKFVQDHS